MGGQGQRELTCEGWLAPLQFWDMDESGAAAWHLEPMASGSGQAGVSAAALVARQAAHTTWLRRHLISPSVGTLSPPDEGDAAPGEGSRCGGIKECPPGLGDPGHRGRPATVARLGFKVLPRMTSRVWTADR